MWRKSLAAAAAACGLVVHAPLARAGGLEYVGAGAQALARGGAVSARAEDAMVLAYNPAGLAELRGTQFLLNMNLALFDACIDPAGYYGWGLYLGGQNSRLHDDATGDTRTLHLRSSDPLNAREKYYTTPLDTVCMKQHVVPIPQLAWTTRISERLGIGAGLIFPAVQPSGTWGGQDGVIHGADGSLRPAATRYMQLSASNLGVFPTLAVGYRLAREFRLGAAFEWGIVAVNTSVMATSGGGTIPARDIVAKVKAQDFFVPALTLSAHAVPVDALDVVAGFRFQDDVHSAGKLDTTTGLFDPGLVPHTTRGLEITSLRQRMPWKLRVGVRYADRFAPRASGTGAGEGDPARHEPIHDPLQDERWDLEFDAEYQRNSRNQKQHIEYAQGQRIEFASAIDGRINGVAFPNADVPYTEIEKAWKDQISLRVGGTLNLVPGLFGVSAGVHYENRGVDPSFMQADIWPLARVGLHAGVIVRVAQAIDLVASYGHIFQETLVVAPPADQPASTIWNCYIGMPEQGDHCVARAGTIETISKSLGPMTTRTPPPPREAPAQSAHPDGTAKLNQNLTSTAQSQPAWIVNSGRYRSHYDVIAVGMNIHF